MITAEKDASNITLGSETYEGRQYKDVYLDMMIQGSALQLEAEAIEVSLMDPYSEDYDNSYYSACFKMHSIWCTEDALMGELNNKYIEEDHQCNISKLEFDNNNIILFSVEHYSPINGTKISESVSINSMEYGSSISLNDEQLELSKIRKEQDKIKSEYYYSLCKNGSLAILSTISPGAAMAASIGASILEGSAGKISGVSSFFSKNWQKTAFSIGNSISDDTVNTLINLRIASQNIYEANSKALMEMLGSGASYDIIGGGIIDNIDDNIAFVGIHNPDTLRAINYWSSYGAVGWSGWNSAEIDIIYKGIQDDQNIEIEKSNNYKDGETNYTYEEFLDQCRKILYGGVVFSENEMNMELFNDVVETIMNKTNVNLKEEFKDLIKENHGAVVTE